MEAPTYNTKSIEGEELFFFFFYLQASSLAGILALLKFEASEL